MTAAADALTAPPAPSPGLPYRIARAAYHALRDVPDRLLRRSRNRRAIARIRALGRPRSILVVCLGNICRSPYLAAVLERALPEAAISSAGFVGAGRPVPENARIAAARRGFDLASFRSRPINAAATRQCDLVIVMDAAQRRRLVRLMRVSPARIIVAGDLDPAPAARRAILDPWMQDMAVFEATFDRLDRCAAALADLVNEVPPSGALGDRGRARDQR